MPETAVATRSYVRVGAFVFAALALPATVRAQGNYRSTPTGGRSALLGDTGVALGGDGSSPFLNPATIVRIHDANLAFSVNFFAFTATHYDDWHAPGPVDVSRFGPLALGGSSVNATRLDAIPSTLCLFFTVAGWGDAADAPLVPEPSHSIAPHTGRQKLGACIGTTEDQELELPAVSYAAGVPGGATHTAQSLSQSWRRVHFGPSYGVDLTDELTVGISLHGALASYDVLWSSSAVTSDVTGQPVTSSLDASGSGHSLDFDAILGATWRAGDLTLGFSAEPPSVHAYGSYEGSLHQQATLAGTDTALLSTASGGFRAPVPARVAVGAGGRVGRLTLEIDGTYFFATNTAFEAPLSVETSTVTNGVGSSASASTTFTASARPVLDTAIGAEYFLSPSFSVLGGFDTDISSAPDLVASPALGNFYSSRINRAAVSFGVGSYGEAGTLLVGTQLSLGWGQALAVDPYVLPNSYAAVDARTYGVLLVVAGSTNVHAMKEAVESVERMVKPPEKKKEDDTNDGK